MNSGGKRQKAKGKRQKAKGKRQKAKGSFIPFFFICVTTNASLASIRAWMSVMDLEIWYYSPHTPHPTPHTPLPHFPTSPLPHFPNNCKEMLQLCCYNSLPS
nr:unnamed protein product [Microcystis aeruginosa PCC 7806]